MLGALRHEGFIPHDDDADVECLESDVPRIRDAFAAGGLPGQLVESGAWGPHRMARLILWDTIFLDVFLRRDLTRAKSFPSEEEIFPTRRYEFHGLQLKGPHLAEAAVEIQMALNCEFHAVSTILGRSFVHICPGFFFTNVLVC